MPPQDFPAFARSWPQTQPTVAEGIGQMDDRGHQNGRVTCSFCGKTPDQVSKIIAGTNGHICDACVALCNDILTNAVVDAESGNEAPIDSSQPVQAHGWRSYSPNNPMPLPGALRMVQRQLTELSERLAQLAARAEGASPDG
jgi:ClpX C4-type zinc finger